jgi:hypothetical protein
MPDYSDSLTLKQVVDVVAYLKSLTRTAGEHGGHAGIGKMKI